MKGEGEKKEKDISRKEALKGGEQRSRGILKQKRNDGQKEGRGKKREESLLFLTQQPEEEKKPERRSLVVLTVGFVLFQTSPHSSARFFFLSLSQRVFVRFFFGKKRSICRRRFSISLNAC